MNKPFILILIVLAVVLVAYNVTLVDFENPLVGNSVIALIGIAASLCAIVLMLIYVTSKKIEKKINEDK
jgi:uncharacterized membrane protein (DUF485 family)